MTEAAHVADSAEPILRLRGVGRRFGGLDALVGVDLDVRPGERRGILGPNGAGKTTLFNVVAGEFPPTSGRIVLFGQDVTYLPARSRVGLGLTRTYQTSRLFLGLSVEDNLYLSVVGVEGGHLRPVLIRSKDGPMRSRAREIAEQVGLAPRLNVVVRDLSHGEHRQLEVGMALAGDPRVMMLDEPAAGLSPTERTGLTEMLLTLPREMTLLLIEHDMDVALRVAEYVTMMHDGRVIVEGTPAEIRANELVHDLYLGRGHYGED